jgi:hypothetical protein
VPRDDLLGGQRGVAVACAVGFRRLLAALSNLALLNDKIVNRSARLRPRSRRTSVCASSWMSLLGSCHDPSIGQSCYLLGSQSPVSEPLACEVAPSRPNKDDPFQNGLPGTNPFDRRYAIGT